MGLNKNKKITALLPSISKATMAKLAAILILLNTAAPSANAALVFTNDLFKNEADRFRIGQGSNTDTTNLTLEFGSTNMETLGWVTSADLFNFSDTVSIGGSSETLANAGFTLDDNDLFVAGQLGVESDVFTDGDFFVGNIGLNDVGTSNITSGASLIGVFDEFANTDATTIQAVLNDFDDDISASEFTNFDEAYTNSIADTDTTMDIHNASFPVVINVDSDGSGAAFRIADQGGTIADFSTAGAVAFTPTSGQEFDITTTGAGNIDFNAGGTGAVTVDTTDGSISLNAVGATAGDISLTAGDDITVNASSSAGIFSLNASNGTAVTNIGTGTTTGTITIGGTGTQTLDIGNGAGVKTTNLGSSNTTSATTLLSGSGGLNLNVSNNQATNINTGTSSGAVTIGGNNGTVAVDSSSWDITTLGAASGFTSLGLSGDITMYDAVNDGNPRIRVGATDAEEAHFQAVYDAGAQTLDYALFTTDVASAGADQGMYRFNVDGTDILDIDDGGINFAASRGISIAGTDIITDAAGTATLGNIDAIDATTENSIEATVFDADAESITGVWEVQDNVAFQFGNDGDVLVQYDETTDDRLEITGTNANVFIEDNLFVNSDLDVVDNITVGDIIIDEAAGVLSFTGATSASITSAAALTIGDGGDPLNVNGTTGNWDLTDLDFDIAGNASEISLNANGAADDLTVEVTGAFDSSLLLNSAGTGTDAIALNASAGGLTLDAAGALDLNSSTGAINIGNDAVAQAINIGTGAAARTITVGNATGATAVDLDAGTGGFSFDTNGTAADSFDVNVTGTAGGITMDTTDGAFALTTAGAANGDITLSAADDISITASSSAGIFSLNASNGTAVTNIGTGTTTGAVAIGGNNGTVAVDSSSWDITTLGAASGFTTFTGSGDITTSGGDFVVGSIGLNDFNDNAAQDGGNGANLIGADDDVLPNIGAFTTVQGAINAIDTALGLSTSPNFDDVYSNAIVDTDEILDLHSAGDTFIINTNSDGTGAAFQVSNQGANVADFSTAGRVGFNPVSGQEFDITTAGAGNIDFNAGGTGAVTVDTTDGSISLNAVGAAAGDISLTAGDDITVNASSSAGIFSLNASNGTAVTNIGTGTTTGAVTIGGNANTVAIDSSSWDITTLGAASGLTTLGLTGDITMYDAVNDGNPLFRTGAADAEEAHIQAVYDTGAQTLDHLLFRTETADAAADEGRFTFQVDETATLDIDDGGINFAASRGISIAGTDIITDAAGTATLSNIDAIDATTEDSIEATIFDADAENISGVWEVQDNVAFQFGTDADVLVQYDETTDDRLEITGTNANVFIEDNLFVNSDLDVLDNLTAGDIIIDEAAGVLSFTGATSASITSAAALTIGDGGDAININSSDWDIATDGAITGVSFDANGSGNSISNIDNADLTNDTINLDKVSASLTLDEDTAMGAAAGIEFTTNKTFTNNTGENGEVWNFTASDTGAATTTQHGILLNNAASTEGMDALLALDNADVDDNVVSAIKVLNSARFDNIFDIGGVLISAAELTALDGSVTFEEVYAADGDATLTASANFATAVTGTTLLDTTGVFEINSSAGAISIGNDAVAQNLNLGTGGARTIAIGSAGATAVTADADSFSIDADAAASNITLTANSAADDLTVEVTGNTDSSLFLQSAGSGTDALTIRTQTNGGDIVIDSNDAVSINSSDWDIDATGAMTNMSFDANGTGNAISNIENADLAANTLDWDRISNTTSLDADTSIAVGAAEEITTNKTFTNNTGENGEVWNFTASDTGAATTTQHGILLNNAASTEGVDALLALDNADADDNVVSAIKVLNSARFDNIFDIGGTLLTGSEIGLLDSGIALSELTDSGTLTAGTVDINGGAIDGTTIGATTPSTGAFTTLSSTGATTIGNNSATVAINSSDWDITTAGNMTGIGDITADGAISLGDGGDTWNLNGTTGNWDLTDLDFDIAGNASEISLNANGAADDLTVEVTGNTDSSLFLQSAGSGTDALTIRTQTNGGDIVIDSNDAVSINSADWDITTAGAMTGIGAITMDGLLTGTLGATITGATINLNASSNFATNIGTGTTTSTVTVGGNANAVVVASTGWDITSGGQADFGGAISSADTFDINAGGDLTVGTTGETLSGAFAFSGNDAFIEDSLGVEGAIYTDTYSDKYIWLDAGAAVRTSAALGTIASSHVAAISFDETNASNAVWNFQVPEDANPAADMTVTVFWSPEDNLGADDNVRFTMDYESFANGDTMGTAPTDFTNDFEDQAPSNAALKVVTTAGSLVIADASANIDLGEMISIDLGRDPADSNDTYGDDNAGADPGDIRVLGVRITYQGKKLQ